MSLGSFKTVPQSLLSCPTTVAREDKQMMSKPRNGVKLGNGIEQGGHHGNTDLGTIGSVTERIHRTLRDHDIGRDASHMDADQLTDGEHWFLTPMGEVVHVSAISPADGGEGTVKVLFPERDSLDESGEPQAFAYTQSVDALMARMDADGGWKLVERFQIDSAPNCPRCNRFMTTGRDYTGFPFAQCKCGCDIGVDAMVEQGAVIEVF